MHALIMAGGRSERMRSSAGPAHKALKRVLAVSLIERNISRILAFGLRTISIAVNVAETELIDYIHRHVLPLAHSMGARISLIVEEQGLGNIGAARLVHTSDDLLVIYVDNLCVLDIALLQERHVTAGAALTVATRRHVLRNPFGELTIKDGYITAYHEKPVYESIVSSGTCILGPDARGYIPEGTACNAVDLFQLTRTKNAPIAAFEHDTPWIDINDERALALAERIVETHMAQFECLCERPDKSLIVLHDGNQMTAYEYAGTSNEHHGCEGYAIFDDIDEDTGNIIRYTLVAVRHNSDSKTVYLEDGNWTRRLDISNRHRVMERVRAWTELHASRLASLR